MKRKTKIVLVTVGLFLAFTGYSFAATGWTSYGTVGVVQADSVGFTAVVSVATNPSACQQQTIFYYDFSTGSARGNRMYATLLSAYSLGSEVRLYVGDDCNVYNQTNILAISVR